MVRHPRSHIIKRLKTNSEDLDDDDPLMKNAVADQAVQAAEAARDYACRLLDGNIGCVPLTLKFLKQ
jgi:hypothetical protein